MTQAEANGHAICNPQAERGLLGALLFDNSTVHDVEAILPADGFADPLHAAIYEAIRELVRAHKRADPITLSSTFQNAAHVALEDGRRISVPLYLGKLTAEACLRTSIVDYAHILDKLRERREVLQACQASIAAATDPTGFGSTPAVWSDTAAKLLRAGAPSGACLEARCLANVEPAPINWLWQERLALGKLSLIAGAPGLGKSQLTCALTATVTKGGHWPDGTLSPLGSVVFITCEDDPADTIRPRLDAAGADVGRVHLLDWVVDANVRTHFDVRRHIPGLSRLLQQIGDVRLVVIDPITAYLGRTDSHVAADVRNALNPLQVLAAESGAAIVIVSHLNKSASDRSAMNRVTGSGAFVAICRSAWLIGPDPQDTSKRRRVFTPIKNNIGDDRTGFAYTIESRVTGRIASSAVVFDPTPIQVAADDVLQGTAQSEGTALSEAIAFLRKKLADGPKPSRWVEEEASDAGIGSRTLETARQRLGVHAERLRNGWRIRLPDHTQ